MYKKCRIFAVLLLILLVLIGCGHQDGDPVADVSLQDLLERAAAPVSAAGVGTVGVYVDVTTSMRGFLDGSGKTDTLYSLCLNTLGRQIASNYENVTFYRVDTPLWKVIEPEDVLEKARNTSYYKKSETFPKGKYDRLKEVDGYGNGYDSLCLTAALEEGTSHDLFILITDLYENSIGTNTNANSFISKIQQLTDLNDGKVFGLIGVKSIFAGPIYDTGPNGTSVYYGVDSPSYRPFYILLRGYPEHVQDFCETLGKRLEALDAERGTDYEISAFYEAPFWGLDYTAWKECANQLSPKKKFLWQEDLTVTVRDAAHPADTRELPVFGYQMSGKNAFQDHLYFAYSIAPPQREGFHMLAQEIGENASVSFLPEGKKVLCELPCLVREQNMRHWDGKAFDSDGRKDAFEVCRLYYDREEETLYAELSLDRTRLCGGLWRLDWKHVLEPRENASNSWLTDWQSPEGENADYSKTERLLDYAAPILKKMSDTESCVLHGTVYLNIQE